MATYDGNILINTRINVKNAEVQLSALENRMVKTADKIESLRVKMDALKDAKIPTQEYTENLKQIEAMEKKLVSLYDRQERFLETGGKEDSSVYRKMVYDAEQLEKRLEIVKQATNNLVNSGKAFTLGQDTQEYARLGEQMQSARNELEQMNRQHELLNLKRDAAIQKADREQQKIAEQTAEEQRLAQIKENATAADQELIDLLERRRELTERIRELERAGVTEGYAEHDAARQELSQIEEQIAAHRREREAVDETQSAHERFGAAVKSTLGRLISLAQRLAGIMSKVVAGSFKAFGKVAVKTASSVASGMLRLTTSMIGLGKSTKRTNNIFSGGLKNILKPTVCGYSVNSERTARNATKCQLKKRPKQRASCEKLHKMQRKKKKREQRANSEKLHKMHKNAH